MRKLAPLFATLLLLAVASLTVAQSSMPLDRIDVEQGSVHFTGSTLNPQGQFTFRGAGLSLSGGLVEGFFSPVCQPCTGGEQIHIKTVFSGEQSIRPGTLTTMGTTGRDIFYTGDLTFDSNPVTLPTRYTRTPIRISVPITVQGWLDIYERNPFLNSNYFLFRTPLNLQGTATLTLSMWGINPANGRPFYRFRGLSYEFPAIARAGEN